MQTFDLLPSPSNLKWLRLISEASCFLCRKSVCISAHILRSCKVALHQGCLSFRHGKVICELVVTLKHFFSSYKLNTSSDINFINFVREGKKSKTASHKGFLGTLHSTSDWNFKFDLDGVLVVPVILMVSTLVQIYYFFYYWTKLPLQRQFGLAHLDWHFKEVASTLTKMVWDGECRLAQFHAIKNFLPNEIYHFPRLPHQTGCLFTWAACSI